MLLTHQWSSPHCSGTSQRSGRNCRRELLFGWRLYSDCIGTTAPLFWFTQNDRHLKRRNRFHIKRFVLLSCWHASDFHECWDSYLAGAWKSKMKTTNCLFCVRSRLIHRMTEFKIFTGLINVDQIMSYWTVL